MLTDHVWFHGGLDIISFCILLFALARETPSQWMLRAVAVAALMPTIAIAYSYLATTFWSPLFLVPGFGCLAFVLAGRVENNKA